MIRIIHCDDHSLFRYGVRTALADRKDIEIIGESENGLELLRLLETIMPDIVILNITMPVLDGIATLPRIKEKYPDLKVIVLSMRTDRDTIIKAMELGANSYISKNSGSEDIYRAVKCVDEYNYYYSEMMDWAFLGPGLFFERTGRRYSDKELRMLELMKENKTEREISEIMDITEKTVSAMISKLKRAKAQ